MTNFGNPMSACGLQDPSQSNFTSFMTNAPSRSVYEPLGLASPSAYLANHPGHHHAHHHQAAAAAAAAAAAVHNQRNTNCQIGYTSNMVHQSQHQPQQQQQQQQQHQQQQQQQQQANLNTSNGIYFFINFFVISKMLI
jgi:ADP-ribosylglycohydrolase